MMSRLSRLPCSGSDWEMAAALAKAAKVTAKRVANLMMERNFGRVLEDNIEDRIFMFLVLSCKCQEWHFIWASPGQVIITSQLMRNAVYRSLSGSRHSETRTFNPSFSMIPRFSMDEIDFARRIHPYQMDSGVRYFLAFLHVSRSLAWQADNVQCMDSSVSVGIQKCPPDQSPCYS